MMGSFEKKKKTKSFSPIIKNYGTIENAVIRSSILHLYPKISINKHFFEND